MFRQYLVKSGPAWPLPRTRLMNRRLAAADKKKLTRKLYKDGKQCKASCVTTLLDWIDLETSLWRMI